MLFRSREVCPVCRVGAGRGIPIYRLRSDRPALQRRDAISVLPEQTREEILRYYFLRQPQRVIGVHIGRTRSTAGRHKIRYLLDRQCSIIKSTTIKIYGGKYEKEIQHVA